MNCHTASPPYLRGLTECEAARLKKLRGSKHTKVIRQFDNA